VAVTVSRRALLRVGIMAGVWTLGTNGVRSIAASEQPSFVQPRLSWGAAPPGPGLRQHTIARVTLHHTGPPPWYGAPDAAAYLQGIQAFHMGPERRWPDIAYHLLVDLDGVVWEGRSLAVAGDSATPYDTTGHALVAVLGDYDLQHPNDAQRAAVMETVRWLGVRWNVKAAMVGGHRDYAATACPGEHLYALLPAIRAAL